MTDKSKIKIVKRSDVKDLNVKKHRVKRSREAARKMVSNVTDWVAELKQRKSDETKAALDMLFSNSPEPSNP